MEPLAIAGLGFLRRLVPGVPRKEVIQPHLPIRLPCYDFTPVMMLTVAGAIPCGLRYLLLVDPTPMV